eukprot:g25687.t1
MVADGETPQDQQSQADSDGTGGSNVVEEAEDEEEDDDRIAFRSADGFSFEETGQAKTEDFLRRYESVDCEEFELARVEASLAELIKDTWQAFLQKYSAREFAGEAILDAIFEEGWRSVPLSSVFRAVEPPVLGWALGCSSPVSGGRSPQEAPTLEGFFKMPRSVFGIRFTMAVTNIMDGCGDSAQLKRQVETLGFQHMDLDITVPRVHVIRDIILGVMEVELGQSLEPLALQGIKAVLNYTGGAFIFVKREFAGLSSEVGRLRTVKKRSWPKMPWQAGAAARDGGRSCVREVLVDQLELQDNEEITAILHATGGIEKHAAKVPTSFNDMFLFNAAVMGFSESKWMKDILTHLDDIAVHVANKCDVMSMVLAKYKGVIHLYEFKAVMLASLRSVVPQDWDMEHETAWIWLWENIERMLPLGSKKNAVFGSERRF